MATASTSIPPAAFAAALHSLPLTSIYAKVAELRNSLTHLHRSDAELDPYAAAGDRVCIEAIASNSAVILRTEERIRLCRAEVERRGQRFSAHGAEMDGVEPGERVVNGHVNGEGAPVGGGHAQRAAQAQSGRLTDEELRRRVEAQMAGAEEREEGEAGVHL